MESKFLNKIPNEWLLAKSNDTNIFIIDGGCNVENNNFKNNIKNYKEFGMSLRYEHGTHVTGIICSNADNVYSVNGLSHDANIYYGAIDVNKKSFDMQIMINVLEWMLNLNITPHVLNLSLAWKTDNLKIKELLKEFYRKGCIICCASSKTLEFPHSYNFVISVANDESYNCDIIAPSSFNSTTESGYRRLTGTSMACAYVSSVAGIAKSYKNMNKDEFLANLIGDYLINCNIDRNLRSEYVQINLE